MTYKAILFDLDNTLLDFDRSWIGALRHSLAEVGLNPDDSVFWESFRDHFDRTNTTYWLARFERKLHNLEVLELSYRDTFRALEAEYPAVAAVHPRDVAATYWERFCSSYLPEEGAKETVELLHGRYKLGIVSNGIGEAQHKRLLAGGLRRRFEALIVSDEAGVAKPDPGIFAAALRQLNVERQEVLFVGDSLHDDYAGARAAGIDFCLYNRRRQPLPPDIRPAYEIQRLQELAELLHKMEDQC